MKSIDELAEELNIEPIGHYDSLTDGDYIEYTVTKSQLKSFARAYMQDRLNELNPVAWNLRRHDWRPHHYSAFNENYSWASDSIPLYDISSLMGKG